MERKLDELINMMKVLSRQARISGGTVPAPPPPPPLDTNLAPIGEHEHELEEGHV